jgi:NOL1/NOP2/fmu family ribosome biogenesis protein
MSAPKLNILDSAKKKKIIDQLAVFGIKKIPYLLVQTGKERIVAFSGSLAREELSKLSRLLSVEGIGVYFAKDTNEGLRLSVDGLHIMKEQIKSNIIELDEKQEREWFLGKNIELSQEQEIKYSEISGFVAIKAGEDFVGTGRKTGNRINNFLPKERRIKS